MKLGQRAMIAAKVAHLMGVLNPGNVRGGSGNCGLAENASRSYQEGRMKRVNLDPNAAFIGNRPPKPEGVQLIRRHDQRRPMIDIEGGDVGGCGGGAGARRS